MEEIPFLSSILNYRDKIIKENQSAEFSIFQAYSFSIFITFLVIFLYCLIKKRDIRYSTLLTIGAIVFVLSMMLIPSPEQKFYRVVAVLVVALLVFEILGYEIMRIMRERNRAVSIENFFEKLTS
jgi:hypothetical protein